MKIPGSHAPLENSFWNSLFAADSIAVVGARDAVGSWGYDAMRAALESARAREGRRAYAVNPNVREVLGVTAYKNILDIPGPVELGIIVVPANIVPEVVRQCVQKGARAAVIISAGFAEVDAAGAALEAALLKTAREGGLHFVGPNCIGHAHLHSRIPRARR